MVINRQLFSAVYLRELQQGKHAADILDGSRQTIREWRENYPVFDAAARREYVKQCLSALGAASTWKPETNGFMLFADASRQQATGLCLVTAEENLGRTVRGAHPQAMLIRELRQAGLKWGILTNGTHWRLCRADAPAPYEVFLEVNLDELIAAPSLKEFLLFHRFFGGEAFGEKAADVPNGKAAQTSSRLGSDRFADESERRTEAIERHLKSNVEPILQKLCLGFVENESRDDYDADTLQVIYQNAIYLLYRILFLFYAESRGLLPTENADYAPVSLAALVARVRQRQQEGVVDADAFSLWKALTRLFVIVDEGDVSLDVAAYNGGLFNDEEKPYLKHHRIRDDYLAPALFALGFEEQKKQQASGKANGSSGASNPTSAAFAPIDYRDLSVRHLGTLYEGLLEYRLNRVFGEPRVIREEKGKRKFVRQSLAGPIKKGETVLEVGQVYFADDKGERKQSGSYYTPEDVVQYIVANTVAPKLREKREPLDALLAEIAGQRAVAVSPEERQQLERYADQETLKAVEQSLLRLKILDPAMGSGHFLVAAAQTVTDCIVETLNDTEWISPEITTDPLVWKRRVVERCLFGVDKNPLAQELAKLSLWIASASAGKPLTFLDHHLKIGNSLYGTPLNRLAALPKLGVTASSQPKSATSDLFSSIREQTIQAVLRELAEITNVDSDSIAVVKHKGEANKSAHAFTERLRVAANVWLATLFGLQTGGGRAINGDEYAQVLEHVTHNYAKETWDKIVADSAILQNANAIADRECFLHWELEFPDAVVDGTCRFDAVIANPPYVGTPPNTAITTLYETAKCSDLYAWIFEKSLQVTGDTGNMGTIVPLSLMFSRQFKTLRAAILKRRGIARFANFDIRPAAIFGSPGSPNGQRATIALLQSKSEPLYVETTNMIRFSIQERPYLIRSLQYADVTPLVTEDTFPKLGDQRLVEFWLRVTNYDNTISGALYKPEKKTSNPPLYHVFVSGSGRYFITAMPNAMRLTGLNIFSFESEWQRDVAMVTLNSNVFYWLWFVQGDGFHITGDNTIAMLLPKVPIGDAETVCLRDALLNAANSCATYMTMRGQQVPNYNFNKRMEILLDIDAWIVKHVAPDLNLPRDIFAHYKSPSFLRPFELSATNGAEEEDEE